MRLHKNLVFAAVDGLDTIFNKHKQADKVLQEVLKRDKRWGSRDRGFIAETTYDIVRWKRLYTTIAEVKEPFSRTDLYRLFGVWATLKGIALPNWKQFENTPVRRIKGRFDEYSKNRKIAQSIPDWLDEVGEKELGKQWDEELKALNKQAPVVLRTNSLKSNLKNTRQALAAENVDTLVLNKYPDALQLIARQNVFTTQVFKDGYFEVQDAASQLVAPFVDAQPGMRVIDACAGAGGKSLHLAALMQNKGQLIAMDIYSNKLKELKRRAKRAGAFNIETRLISTTKDIKKLHQKADRVLIDAPCSGLGTLKRSPDIKWKLKVNFLQKIKNTQQELLKNYSKMIKPGGKMVYATCSILPSENEQQIARFLATEEGAKFVLNKERKCSPAIDGYDGFYMVQLELKT